MAVVAASDRFPQSDCWPPPTLPVSYTCTRAHTHTHTHTHRHMHRYAQTRARTYKDTHADTQAPTCTRTHTHTHTVHIDTQTDTQIRTKTTENIYSEKYNMRSMQYEQIHNINSSISKFSFSPHRTSIEYADVVVLKVQCVGF